MGQRGKEAGPPWGSQWGEGVGARLLELRARGKLARWGRGQGGKELDRGWRKTHGGFGRGQTQGQGDWSLGAGALMALGSGGLRRGTRAFLEPHCVLPSYPPATTLSTKKEPHIHFLHKDTGLSEAPGQDPNPESWVLERDCGDLLPGPDLSGRGSWKQAENRAPQPPPSSSHLPQVLAAGAGDTFRAVK